MKSLLTLAAVLLLSACHQKSPEHRLVLSLDPPELRPGVLFTVTAVPDPAADLKWVSGTVKVMGAADLPFRRDEKDGRWKFRSMIPAFVSLPAGSYQARAWGEDLNGRRFEGELTVAVK